jgi:mannose-6-phosphate isomerase-like protein (cupin superfamily)
MTTTDVNSPARSIRAISPSTTTRSLWGETLLNGLHTHLDQGKAFYILEGTATFETKSDVTADSEIIKM